jgi:hypothetical protein
MFIALKNNFEFALSFLDLVAEWRLRPWRRGPDVHEGERPQVPHAVSEAANFINTGKGVARDRRQLGLNIPEPQQRNGTQANGQRQQQCAR